jgi:hypothetical protein
MIGFVRSNASDRKFRLLASAACRRVWHLLEDERSRRGVEAAELHADGLIDDVKLDAALIDAFDASEAATYREDPPTVFVPRCNLADSVMSLTQPPTTRDPETGRSLVAYRGWEAFAMISGAMAILRPESVIEAVPYVEGDITFGFGIVHTETLSLDEQLAQADLIRDVFGNPFRPVSFDPAWRTSAVLSLSQAAYDKRNLPSGELDPDRLAVLSDTLEEAGCGDLGILGHLRGRGPHLRGCWAVDLLLGKE